MDNKNDADVAIIILIAATFFGLILAGLLMQVIEKGMPTQQEYSIEENEMTPVPLPLVGE